MTTKNIRKEIVNQLLVILFLIILSPVLQATSSPPVLHFVSHHFYLSEHTGLPVYVEVELPNQNAFSLRGIHLFEAELQKLPHDGRLLVVKYPGPESFQPDSLSLFPRTKWPDWAACKISQPKTIVLQENPVEPYELHALSSPINPECSWIQMPTGEQISFFSTNEGHQTYPDGLWLLETSLIKTGEGFKVPVMSKAEGFDKLLYGGFGGGSWPKFDFKPGGGRSRLLDIDIIFTILPMVWEKIVNGNPVLRLREKDGISVEITDIQGNSQRQFYTMEQAKKILENKVGTDLLQILHGTHLTVKSTSNEDTDLLFSESMETIIQQMGEWNRFHRDLENLNPKMARVDVSTVPGIISIPNFSKQGGKSTASNQQAPSQNSGWSAWLWGSSEKGGAEGGSGGSGGSGRNNNGDSPSTSYEASKESDSRFTYAFDEYISTEEFVPISELVSQDESLNELTCQFCSRIANNAEYCQCCEKIACRQCWVNGPRECPGCNHRPYKLRDQKNQEKIEELEVYCPYKNEGCSTRFKIGEFRSHLDSCAFNQGHCPKCDARGSRSYIYAHLKYDHDDTMSSPLLNCPSPSCTETLTLNNINNCPHCKGGEEGNKQNSHLKTSRTSGITKTKNSKEACLSYSYIFHTTSPDGKKFDLEVELVRNDVELDDYECPVCLNICNNPYGPECGHLVCKNCYQKLNQPICPKCRRNLTFEQKTAENTFINTLTIFCPNKEKGCEELPSIGQLPEHYNSCHFTPRLCRNDGCVFKGTFNEVDNHQSQCLYKLVECPNASQGCQEQCLQKDVNAHIDTCSYLAIDCENTNCSFSIARNEMDRHLAECSYSIMTCNFEGCNHRCTRSDMNEHKKRCNYSPIPCEHCEEVYKLFEIEKHQKNCGLRKEPCKLCNNLIPMGSMVEHVTTCLQSFHSDCNDCKRLAGAFSIMLEHAGAQLEEVKSDNKNLHEKMDTLISKVNAEAKRNEAIANAKEIEVDQERPWQNKFVSEMRSTEVFAKLRVVQYPRLWNKVAENLEIPYTPLHKYDSHVARLILHILNPAMEVTYGKFVNALNAAGSTDLALKVKYYAKHQVWEGD